MKLVTFEHKGRPLLGGIAGEGKILDLADAAHRQGHPISAFTSMQTLIEAGEAAWNRARDLLADPTSESILDACSVRLLAPLPRPVRMRDCSMFLEHMEKGLDKLARTLAARESNPEAAYAAFVANGTYALKPIFREQVIYYNADHLAVSGPDADIVWPAYSDWMDYELEWACIVGRTASDISAEEASRHIFGYTIFNDWSARDIQIPMMSTNLGPGEGKDFAGGNGLGPCIVTPDELEDPYALTMVARVNGEEWSRGSTSTMHHRFEDAIVQFSRCKPLHAGEVIGSGTVLGGCGFELERRLADGDVVELEIEGIGILRNRVVRGL